MKKIKINKLYNRFNMTLGSSGVYGDPAKESLVRIERWLGAAFRRYKWDTVGRLRNEKY